MKAKLFVLVAILFSSQAGNAFACAVCFGARDAKSTEHLAAAVWVMVALTMSVLGGIGAFSFNIWRRSNTPLAPHQELVSEDLQKYD